MGAYGAEKSRAALAFEAGRKLGIELSISAANNITIQRQESINGSMSVRKKYGSVRPRPTTLPTQARSSSGARRIGCWFRRTRMCRSTRRYWCSADAVRRAPSASAFCTTDKLGAGLRIVATVAVVVEAVAWPILAISTKYQHGRSTDSHKFPIIIGSLPYNCGYLIC
jgi:hypothetical protein